MQVSTPIQSDRSRFGHQTATSIPVGPSTAVAQPAFSGADAAAPAESLQAHFGVKFGNASGDDAAINRLPAGVKQIVEVAKATALATNAPQITADHVVYAAAAQLQRLLGGGPKSAEDQQMKATLTKALFPHAAKNDQTEQDMIEMLGDTITSLTAHFEEKYEGMSQSSSVALEPNLAESLQKVGKLDDPLYLLMAVIRGDQGVKDTYKVAGRHLSVLEGVEQNLQLQHIVSAFKKDPGLSAVLHGSLTKMMMLNDADKDAFQLHSLVAGMVALAAEVKTYPSVLKGTGQLPLEQQRVKWALDALIPPDQRKGATVEQLGFALQQAQAKLMKMSPAANPAEAQKNQKAALTALHRFANDSKRSDFSPAALVSYLKTDLAKSAEGPNEAKAVAQVLENIPKNVTNNRLEQMKNATASQSKVAKDPKAFYAVLDEQFLQDNSAMSTEQYAGIKQMIADFENASNQTGDKGKYQRRLDLLLNKMKWVYTETNLDLDAVERQLNDDHTGLEKPKEKILEYIAVQKNLEEQGLPPTGAILGMVGPPGVGKTSLATSLGKATNRQVARIALGGLKKEEDLRGHDSTYVGSLAGRIAKAIAQSGSMNPIVVLDEIDKVGADELKDALLELLDPKQNHKFVDKFIGDEVPIDLSKCMFVLTANYAQQIPPALADRVDMVELEGYDLTEKLAIAKNHLIKQVGQATGLKPEELNFSDEAIGRIVDEYTYEDGVRDLNRKLQSVAAKRVVDKARGKALAPEISADEIKERLGNSKIKKPTLKPATPGRVNGLAVLGSGGLLLRLLCTKHVEDMPVPPGLPKPQVDIRYAEGVPNKNAGEMAYDSLMHAKSYLRSEQGMAELKRQGFDAEAYRGKRIELAPQTEDAGKMDGPSAGAAKVTLMTSVLTNRPIRHDIAMTGTITALGEVGAIGGLKQKIRGATAAGARVVLFPKDNFEGNEWLEIPDRVKAKLELTDIETLKKNPEMKVPKGKDIIVCPVDRVEDVMDVCLLPGEKKAKATAVADAPSPEAPAGPFSEEDVSVLQSLVALVRNGMNPGTAAAAEPPKFSGNTKKPLQLVG